LAPFFKFGEIGYSEVKSNQRPQRHSDHNHEDNHDEAERTKDPDKRQVLVVATGEQVTENCFDVHFILLISSSSKVW